MNFAVSLAITLAVLHGACAMSLMNDPATGSYSFSYDTGTGGYHEQQGKGAGPVSGKYGFTGAGGSNVAVSYSAGGGADKYPGGGNQGVYNLKLNPEGVYAYDYTLTDQSKSESRDASGKVKGMFSYKDKDGHQKSITYTADEGGFQPIGDHLPKPVEPLPYMDPYMASMGVGGSPGLMNLNMQPGGIYSYDYSFPDQSKSESRSADGKVKGKFSYKGKDGMERSIIYTADEGGFQPQGDHIPKDSNPAPVPVPSFSPQPSNNGGSVQGKYSIEDKGNSQKSSYNAGPEGFNPIHSITINFQ